MAATLDIIIKAQDEASKVIAGVGDQVDAAQKKFADASKASGILLGGLVALTGVVAVTSVKAFLDAEKSMAKVGATLATIKGATAETTKEVIKLSQAATQLGFDDEAAAESIAFLYQRTGDLTKANELTALSMDLARAKSIDLSTASNMVSLVLSGNARALKQYGITLDETKTPMEALAELQGKVAGQAEGFAKTTGGSLQVLNQNWINLKETIGGTIATAITPWIQALSNAVAKINEAGGVIQAMTKFFEEHQTAIIIVAGVIVGALVPALATLALSLAATAIALAPYLIGGAIIGALVAGIVWIVQNWDMIAGKAKEIWGGIAAFLSVVWASITGAIQDTWNYITTYLQSVWDSIVNIFSFAVALAAGVVITAFDAMGIDIVAVFETIKTTLTAAWEFIKTLFTAGTTAVQTGWNATWTAIKDFLTPVWDAIKTTVQTGWEFIQNIFNTIAEPIKTAWSGLWNGLKTILDGVWDGIKASVTSGIDFVIGKVNSAIEAVNNLAAKGASAIGIKAPAIPTIQPVGKRQAGGPVDAGSPYLVGEAGPELFIPGAAGRIAPNAGINLTVNISGNNIYGNRIEELAEQIGNAIFHKLNLQLRV